MNEPKEPICSRCGEKLIPKLSCTKNTHHDWDKVSYWCECIGYEFTIRVEENDKNTQA